MRNGIILYHYRQIKTGLVLLSVLLLHSLPIAQPCFAERYAPQLEMPSEESENATEENRFTTVDEIEGDSKPDWFVERDTGHVASEEPVPTLKGGVDVEKEFVPHVLFDEIHTVHRGEKLILTIMDMVATGYSQHGDEFNARVKVAVERDGKVLVPKGTLIKGHIVNSDEPGRSLAKKGKITLAFDYILMPDGRKVPFKSSYTRGDNALKAVGRAVGSGIGGTLSGAIRGVLVGLRLGGLHGAAISNGATVIGAGGLGALAGLGRGLSQSGDHVLLNEGDEVAVALEEPLQLPVVVTPPDSQNEIHAEGLDVKITDYSLGRDPFKVEKQINLQLQITNKTQYTFGSFDMALIDEYNDTYFVSPFGNDSLLTFQIAPDSQLSGEVSFSVRSPELRHYLVFYKPYTREVLAKVSLTEALKQLTTKDKANASSKRRKESPTVL